MKFKAKIRIERTVELSNLSGEHAAEAKASITNEQIKLVEGERVIGCSIVPIPEPPPEEPKDVKV